MKPHHVRVHALGVNRVAADLAQDRAACVRKGLLDQWFSSWPNSTADLMTLGSAFRSFPTMRRLSAATAISCIELCFRSHNLPSSLAVRSY